MKAEDRTRYWRGWQKAVKRSFGWIEDEDESEKPRFLTRPIKCDGIGRALGGMLTIGTVLLSLTLGFAAGVGFKRAGKR